MYRYCIILLNGNLESQLPERKVHKWSMKKCKCNRKPRKGEFIPFNRWMVDRCQGHFVLEFELKIVIWNSWDIVKRHTDICMVNSPYVKLIMWNWKKEIIIVNIFIVVFFGHLTLYTCEKKPTRQYQSEFKVESNQNTKFNKRFCDLLASFFISKERLSVIVGWFRCGQYLCANPVKKL